MFLFKKKKYQNVIYDENFFRSQWFENWDELKYVLRKLLLSNKRWSTVLDFGCGPGVMIDLMNDEGIDYTGYDCSSEARELYLKHYGQHPEKYLTSLPENRPFDLFLSFDVFEHMTDEQISCILSQISTIPCLMINVSRVKNIPGHINLKSDKQWIRLFNLNNYHYMEQETKQLRKLYADIRPNQPDLWHKNLFLFERSQ